MDREEGFSGLGRYMERKQRWRAECERRDGLWEIVCPRIRGLSRNLDAFIREWLIDGDAPIAARELLELGIGFGCASCGFLFYGKPAHVTIQREGPPRLLCSACRPTQPEPRRSL